MKRIILVSFAAVFSVGCQGCQTPRPNFDPFLGRTTVPPPATGTVGPPPGIAPDTGGFLQQTPPMNPGTSNQFTPPESNNNLYSPPGVQTSPPVGGYPGGYQSSIVPQKSTTPKLVAQSDPPPEADSNEQSSVQLVSGSQSWTAANAGPSATQPAAVVPASYTSEIKIVDPPSAQSAPAAPPNQAVASDTAATDIMNLPPKNSSRTAQTPTIMEGRQAYRPVSGARYGHDPQYAWLKGRLEQSQVDRRWKLRYIPIDGATDSYGGSVVLDGPQTAGLKPQEFVMVRGQLAAGPQVAGTYAPVYNIEQIEPLDD
jgi:hypothetical protein